MPTRQRRKAPESAPELDPGPTDGSAYVEAPMDHDRAAEVLAGIDLDLTVERGDPRELTLLEVNARFMRHETFQRLVANVKRDKALTSTPLVWVAHATDAGGLDTGLADGARLVLSGNHRVEAAVEAELEEIVWLQINVNLTRDQRLALQLSHNALEGEDDPAVLKQLYESIESVDWKQYSALDDAHLDLINDVDFSSLRPAMLDFQTLSLTFLPGDYERAMKAFADARTLTGKADVRWLARYEDHWRVLDAIATAGAAYDVQNQAAALTYVLDVFEAHRDDLGAGYTDEQGEATGNRWVPLSTVLGVTNVPAPVAVLLARMIDKMVSRDEVSTKAKWQSLEFLAAEYLAAK